MTLQTGETSVAGRIAWQRRKFAELSPDELYAVLELRQIVFIVEQNCAYLDADGLDTGSDHLLGWITEHGRRALAAYARLLPPRLKYAEPSVGRVVTHPRFRGRGIGRVLMREAILEIERSGWGREIRIAAQMYLERFYEQFDFSRVSDPYLEDGIWHVDMRRG